MKSSRLTFLSPSILVDLVAWLPIFLRACTWHVFWWLEIEALFIRTSRPLRWFRAARPPYTSKNGTLYFEWMVDFVKRMHWMLWRWLHFQALVVLSNLTHKTSSNYNNGHITSFEVCMSSQDNVGIGITLWPSHCLASPALLLKGLH
jgi:hypothetical protein